MLGGSGAAESQTPDTTPRASEQGSSLIGGTVLSTQANYYWVKIEGAGSGSPGLLLCTRRARLKKMGQRVMVGDRVQIEEADWAGGRGAIATIYPRQTCLDRPPVANADQVLLVFALAEPDIELYQLSRFLVKAESTGLRVQLCLNKRDRVEAATVAAWIQRLQGWGYRPRVISVATDLTLSLQGMLGDHMTVVSGPSGVGKSSLINRLIPAADLRTGQVSAKLGRGRHTTRHVELFELPGGGLLADTPGFNQPDMTCAPSELARCFPEIRRQQATCQFNDCLHREEPGCAVDKNWERYDLYLELLEEAMVRQEALNQQGDLEASYKVKVTESGQQHEPKLQAKKYRRTSRRSAHQALQDLCGDLSQLDDWSDEEFENLEV